MPRSVWIFLTAILLPSLVLAWLAVRSVRDQQIILEHQQALIDQSITDSLALRLDQEVNQLKEEFMSETQALLLKAGSPRDLAARFDSQIRSAWPPAEVGFALDLNGSIYSPLANDGSAARTFLSENSSFLSNRENAQVYASKGSNNLNNSNSGNYAQGNIAPQGAMTLNDLPQNALPERDVSPRAVPQGAEPKINSQANSWNVQRNVIPSQSQQIEPMLSNAAPEESTFRGVVGSESNGILGRFMDNKLRLMVWYRSPPYIFGAQLRRSALLDRLIPLLRPPTPVSSSEVISSFRRVSSSFDKASPWCLALLDDTGKPVALSRPGFTADWKHPFVATEIGDTLPHWEVALYLTDPGQLGRSARILQLTLALIVLILLTAIVAGGWPVAADIRRRTLLAQQKTDFVSNISHELKTPLTSIRLFADLLTADRVTDPARRASYLRIIAAESARLTRLINNVLDFARLDRGAASPESRPCDFAAIAREVTDNLRPHLESEGITLTTELPPDPLPVLGDRDAISQILLNLLSNAEKYGRGQILLRAGRRQGPLNGQYGDTVDATDLKSVIPKGEGESHQWYAYVEVLDRGPGIPPSQAEAIFQPFHRLEDSLASGIPGTGLGLSLARHNAAAHHGRLTYTPREGGGACFTFTLPLST